MPKTVIKMLLMVAFLAGTPCLHAQSSNKVWFVLWNGKPTPSSDVAVSTLTTAGSATPVFNAGTLVSQTNFPAFNSPYDIAVDPAMGKAYVLDNNFQAGTPEYIYSFNLAGTPAQVAASAQVIYTMPVSPADINSSTYPVISGITLDPTNHLLYFNQFDSVTASNSYIGAISLTNSPATDVFSSSGNSPAALPLYTGQIPGIGPIAIDRTNIYLGAHNPINGANGVFLAPLSGAGSFSSIVTISTLDTSFANGLVSGVASYPQSNLVYYLTFNAGPANNNFSLSQNALWMYNTATRAKTQIASGFSGYPNNIALDPANKRYYFTIGQDGTGNINPTNYQAIYTGIIGVTNMPTSVYVPALSGLDVAGGPGAGSVSLQGIWIQDIASATVPPVAGPLSVVAQKNLSLSLSVAGIVAHDTDPNGGSLSINAVSGSSTNGGSVSLNGSYVTYTPVSNFTGKDQFTYTLTDSEGGSAPGTITVNVLSLGLPASTFLTVTNIPGGKLLIFSGIASQGYVFQYENTLFGPWIDFSPNLTATGSAFLECNDLLPSPTGMRLYRVRTGP